MKQADTTPLMTQLKERTRDCHARLEQLPFFHALSNGSLPVLAYANQLRTFATVFGALEYEIHQLPQPLLLSVQNFGPSRFSHLLTDLGCLGDTLRFEIPQAKHQAETMAASIRRWGLEAPVALLGYLYVLQGTTLGNRVHLDDARRTCSQAGIAATNFYAGYGAGTDEYWAGFCQLVNSGELTTAEVEQVLAAADEAFEFLYRLHLALFPLPAADQLCQTATSLNPEAGNHAVPTDQTELAAALVAGKRCRDDFPYFDARYGERGKRFADSDAAWLASLAGLDAFTVRAQVAWLGGVLASRGMPRITLERQLEHLHEALLAAAPANQLRYEPIVQAAIWLRDERCQRIAPEAFDALCRDFANRTGNELAGSMQGSGALLVSAVCDERAGISQAVTSLIAWLDDKQRFSADWCRVVRETVAQARALAH
jgi:heme oxygenase